MFHSGGRGAALPIPLRLITDSNLSYVCSQIDPYEARNSQGSELLTVL